jgi:signal transduction histidine kinase
MALRNIFENAVTYADESGSVVVETGQGEGPVEIRIVNSGSRLSQEDVEHAFERFWRGDAARTAAGTRCGLGLSLVRKIVSVLGGSVNIKSSPGGEFEITISIPA